MTVQSTDKTNTDTKQTSADSVDKEPPKEEPKAAATTKNNESDNDELDEDGDWLDKSGLKDNQKNHIRKLMSQNKSKKAKLDEINEKLEQANTKLADYEKEKTEAQRKQDMEQGNWKKLAEEAEIKLKNKDEKLMRAEVRNHAIKEGMIDPSLIDLLPIDGVTLNEAGDVIGADKFIAKYKKEKSYLFGEVKTDDKEPKGTTSGKTTPPPNTTVTPKNAMDMTPEQFAARIAEFKKSG